jgi:histidinol-phosphatase (PHP family)
MLTDYHVHLRSDDLGATAAQYFTAANAERYRIMASERGIKELGVSEHVYRFGQALEVWQHPFWRDNACDDLDEYCAFVRERTDLRLGIEADFIPGREDRIANVLESRDFDYVVGAVHFIPRRVASRAQVRTASRQARTASGGASGARGGKGPGAAHPPASAVGGAGTEMFAAVDMDEYGVWSSGWSPEEIWRRYFQTLGEAARSGLFDVLGHPDLVKVFGSKRPAPEGDLRSYYEPAVEGIAESGVAVEVSTAGLRKPVREIYPAPAFLEMCLQAGAKVALSSDAHSPQGIGAGYEQALELLERLDVRELCVFDHRERRLERIGSP